MSFVAGPNGFGVVRLTAGGWEKVPGSLMRIAADPTSPAIAGVNVRGEIYVSAAGDGSDWKQIPGSGVDVAFSRSGQLYVVATDPE